RGEQILPERGVVPQREGRVAERHQRHPLDGHRDVSAAKLRGQVHELDWGKTEYAEHTDREEVGTPRGRHAGRPASWANCAAPSAVWVVSTIRPEVTCSSMIGASSTRLALMKARWSFTCAAVNDAHAVADGGSSTRVTW